MEKVNVVFTDDNNNFYGMVGNKITLSPDNMDYLTESVKTFVDLGYYDIHMNCVYEDVWSKSDATKLYFQLKNLSDYLIQNHLIGNYKTQDKNEITEIENNINALAKSSKSKEYLFPSGSTKLSIKEATVGLTAMVTFIGLYLGIIFLISSAAILGLKELSESSDNKERFRMLRKIGTDEKMINKALFRQIGIFFMLPLILALIHSVFGIKFAMVILEVFGDEQLLLSIIKNKLTK